MRDWCSLNFHFDFLKKESSCHSFKKAVWVLEIISGCTYILPIRCPAIFRTFHPFSTEVHAYFHHNMTFSLILKRNQALIQPRSNYQHWKLSHDDIWWLPQVAHPFKTLSTPLPPSQRLISTKL